MNRHGRKERKLNNEGSALILTLTVLSLIAILGVMALSTSLLNMKMRSLNRRSDKNFYYLETALDEIYAQTGRIASDILKENYIDVVQNLYKENYRTNDEANVWLKTGFIDDLCENVFDITYSASGVDEKENRENAAEKLASFSDTIQSQELKFSIDSVIFEKTNMAESGELNFSAGEDTGLLSSPTDQPVCGSIIFKGFRLVYTNPEDSIESAITVDLKIKAPYVRFMNEGDALLDYVMAANGSLQINPGGGEGLEGIYSGKIYGGDILVEHSNVEMKSSLITAKGDLVIRNTGELLISRDENTGAYSRVWADGIQVNVASKLESEKAGFYVQDDLKLSGDKNQVFLRGNYYGYGNEGYEESLGQKANKSSAILLNDKSSLLNLEELDSLILAGRAYLRFNANTAAGNVNWSQYVYPMGESLAVRATQGMYLVPEPYITVSYNGGATEAAGSNPAAIPEGAAENIIVTVELPDEGGGVRSHSYAVSLSEEDGVYAVEESGDENSPAFLIVLKNKIYVYYNFKDDRERTEFFVNYLDKNMETFESLLRKGGITDSGSGIYINESGQIATSGALYQVRGEENSESGSLFKLLSTGQDGVGSSLSWVQLLNELSISFQNLQENLAETDRVRGRTESGVTHLLPVGNYVRLEKMEKELGSALYAEGEGCAVFLAPSAVTIELNSDGTATVSDERGSSRTMDGGLIVSSKQVTIRNTGSFRGLILSGGDIRIMGNAELTADGQTYEPLLSEDEIAPYFYDYSDVASTVLNDYEDFVFMENWVRAGREKEGGE